MDVRGFGKGRVSAVLIRTSTDEGSVQISAKECVGYAPHGKQTLNTGDQFHQTPGAIVIHHRPRRVSIASGTFDVLVNALSLTEYSVLVMAGQCELCTSLIDKRLQEAERLKVNIRVFIGFRTRIGGIVSTHRLQVSRQHSARWHQHPCWAEGSIASEIEDTIVYVQGMSPLESS